LSRWKPLLTALVTVTLTAACRDREAGSASASFLEAGWRGKDTAEIRGAATAEWCDSLQFLEIQALRGDTGIAIAIYPARQLEAGRVHVVLPNSPDSTRPRAALALRWFAETSIRGFQGDSGAVVIEQPRPGVLTGTFNARAHSVTDAASLTIHGSFRGLVVRPAPRGCPARRLRPDSSAGVH
jgi:hypothetical protein